MATSYLTLEVRVKEKCSRMGVFVYVEVSGFKTTKPISNISCLINEYLQQYHHSQVNGTNCLNFLTHWCCYKIW